MKAKRGDYMTFECGEIDQKVWASLIDPWHCLWQAVPIELADNLYLSSASTGLLSAPARAIGKSVVSQVSCESYIDPVGVLQQLGLLLAHRKAAIGETA